MYCTCSVIFPQTYRWILTGFDGQKCVYGGYGSAIQHTRSQAMLNIKQIINDTVSSASKKEIEQVGLKLIKFCAKWDMQRIADSPESYAEPLNARYKKGE